MTDMFYKQIQKAEIVITIRRFEDDVVHADIIKNRVTGIAMPIRIDMTIRDIYAMLNKKIELRYIK